MIWIMIRFLNFIKFYDKLYRKYLINSLILYYLYPFIKGTEIYMKLLTFIFTSILSFSLLAQVNQGETITAKRFNESTLTIGTIQQSLLTEAEFQSLQGNCWVRMRGQSIATSDLATITGGRLNVLPDTSGRFLRDTGGTNAPSLGQVQGDAIRNIVGQIGTRQDDHAPLTVGTGAFSVGDSGTLANIGTGSGTGYKDANFNASNVVPTTDPNTGENRPINMGVNLFIKINHECN
jgi:hypothetical protein